MNNLDINNIAGALRNLRKFHRLKLKDVSVGTGISIGQLCDIEHGRTYPSIGTLLTIARFYKQDDINYFVEQP